MTIQEFNLYQEQAFDSFSKRVIKHIGVDIHNEDKALAEVETSISCLPFKEAAKLSTEDTYHLEDGAAIRFEVYGFPVEIGDPMLGQALLSLPPKRRDVILLFYFADQNEPQIGQLLHIATMTVNTRRKKALSALREILEGLQYGA
ncbi:RNA polymerase sigma factor [Flavonifractor plautii]|jgi:DNA-directed RNA polymerase specialized sigma24 family protein|uniref:RNA polymerase sigma factor 70 region 4 type 2 domain-containing protein n=1 Tax=Flavonifractor plautii TaxID=292800 RepID=A0A174NFG1_FLAPL|nr:sigma factor-like helix-turn-helix DNA-binding protein [Flavonifractor plautii]MCB6874392.1 hypothetical protein [Flavonifractor plautii]MCB7360493.1 hypothetical protein [Flavonifractor plautii]MCQ4659982.1 hypothetical protein [Flavonifractor plautii]MCQ4683632.1 hypothetical protein [Flavonifractor plautii]MCQ4717931.1 hypothetical protein [Flavonifractor plautii]